MMNESITPNSRPRVVVADDDPDVVRLVCGFLKERYDVTSVANGAAAWQALQTSADAAVLDLHMPEIDGLSLVSRIRASSSLQHLAVILLTGDASQQAVRTAIQNGVDDYLVKMTLRKSDLLEKLSRAIQHRGKKSPASHPVVERALHGASNPPPEPHCEPAHAAGGARTAEEAVPASIRSRAALSSTDLNLQHVLDQWD